MQNSLFRRRLAVRACFDILLEHEIVPSATSNDPTTLLFTSQKFGVLHFLIDMKNSF